jgi:hypothetical protein
MFGRNFGRFYTDSGIGRSHRIRYAERPTGALDSVSGAVRFSPNRGYRQICGCAAPDRDRGTDLLRLHARSGQHRCQFVGGRIPGLRQHRRVPTDCR